MIADAPAQLLRIILHKIVRLEENYSEFISLSNFNDTPMGDSSPYLSIKIRFKRVYTPSQLVYLSAIPHLLARKNKRNVTETALQIVELLRTYITGCDTGSLYPELPRKLAQNLTVETLPSGAIAFKFHAGAIAYWLDHLLHHSLTLSLPSNSLTAPPLSTKLFTIQHTHARCCSLLRLAQEELLIPLEQSTDQAKQQLFTVSTTISWLNSKSKLQTTHASEQSLINWLLLALDEVVEQATLPPKRIWLLAEEGSKAFQIMHRAFPIFGDFRTLPRDRIHAHLTLILLTQRMLRYLLQRLNAIVPDSL